MWGSNIAVVPICIFLMISDVEHLFRYLLAICMTSSGKCLFSSFAYCSIRLCFCYWVVFFLYPFMITFFLTQDQKDFSLVFSSRSYILGFRDLGLWSILTYFICCKARVKVNISYMDVQLFPQPTLPVSLCGTLVDNKLTKYMWICIPGLYLFHWYICLFWHSTTQSWLL